LYFLPTLLPHLELDNSDTEEVYLDELVDTSPIHADPQVLSSALQKLHDLHASLCHCSLRTLRSAVANGHMKGVTLTDLSRTLEECEVCKTAKLRAHTTKNSFADYLATQPFEKVHGDYGGKYCNTWNGKNGFSLYIDKLTYWITGKLVDHKNAICDHFKEFFDEAKILGYPIQALHTDSAKEYIEKQSFIQWLTENGVKWSTSSLYIQYQNGFAEVTMQQVQNHI